MEEWKEYKLGDIVKLTIDYRGKTPLKLGGAWSTSGYRALSAKNIKTGRIVNQESIRFVDEDLYKKWMKDEVQRGDILITSEAPFGQVYYWNSDEKIVLSQRLFCLRLSEDVCPKYVYYYMTTGAFQFELDGRATGTTVTGLRQPELLKCKIQIPSLAIQQQIAKILSSLDDKIEVNRRINENLEQQAQALFKSWFVDFEPFKECEFVESELGMIPKGWRVESLSSIADYINGLAMQKYRPMAGEVGLPVLKIKELGQGNVDSNSELCSPSLIGDKYIINDGDIIFSWSGTLMVKIWCGGKCGLNQHLFVVEPKGFPQWFVFQWTKYHLNNFINIAKDKAVTMGHIKRGELDKAKVLIPRDAMFSIIDSLMKPIHLQIISNEIESRRLASLRDTLLPRLMSGKIRVDEINYL